MGPTREMDTDLRASEREPKVDSAILMIVADDRERRGGVIECLEEMTDVRVEVQRIEEGDFVVERQFVVERKTLRDFAQSLLDGRLFRQASRLAQSSLRRVLVLEGKAEDLRALNVTTRGTGEPRVPEVGFVPATTVGQPPGFICGSALLSSTRSRSRPRSESEHKGRRVAGQAPIKIWTG